MPSPEGTGTAAARPPESPSTMQARFSWLQARLALERTLLAWVRTGAALIGFGFAIFHFFDALDTVPGIKPPWRPGAARYLGVSLVAIGTVALAFALIQYGLEVRYLNGPEYREISSVGDVPRLRPGLIAALAVMIVGIVALWIVVRRLP